MGRTIINRSNHSKKCFSTILLSRLLLISLFFLATNNAFADTNLSSLQKQIRQNKNNQQAQNKLRSQLEEEIASSEQQTAVASLKLQQTEQALKVEARRLNNLKKATKQLEVDKKKQQKLLEQQLISAYMAGQNDLIKLLLNQEDLSKVIRAKSYYYYLNKARLESIEQLQSTQLEIEKNSSEQKKSLLSLQKMRDEQVKNNSQLKQQRNKRSKALRELKQDINYQSARLAQLGDAEKNLKNKLKKQKQKQAKVAKARALAEKASAEARVAEKNNWVNPHNADQKHSKIAKFKGRLNWPINGKVLARFGSKRSDQVKWKGISIAANEGEKVRAVATGRVLFAGYFKGYGMVIALDHSDDYITLYGYNQTLLQKTGDIVLQGDAIALAGHSGGQEKNSLYFELSQKGKAQNPLKWLRPRSR